MPRTTPALRHQDLETYRQWVDEAGQNPASDQQRMSALLSRLEAIAAQRDAAYARVSEALREGTVTAVTGKTLPITACNHTCVPRPGDGWQPVR